MPRKPKKIDMHNGRYCAFCGGLMRVNHIDNIITPDETSRVAFMECRLCGGKEKRVLYRVKTETDN